MPFRLCNAPATFQRLMDEVLHDELGVIMQFFIYTVCYIRKYIRRKLASFDDQETINSLLFLKRYNYNNGSQIA
ncbi:hypothetical protein GLOIN_2v1493923 [Rhizophagus irregularis DAOM 181602=DAOM 197198]|uniref:Uncharacterized protein n=1 Tax=Rhizophagus irregularis (strain DAOM 181602 / DAOM 197198 / MUCL 43194) TaxID=747089 RepID=A0A2P4QYT7_RHIID|nr:hypothetical protein GLOIN_2v1493923 [Rhizophagus irregularis DAOM 181602=DAOM 197198]POG82807.1 hypothetical protein GLOIN_2v1493923 [Rhizophagus irregularis DAOM 181602=DAOM 197198]GET51463.1 hypothetical protein GLOIN_2v1493923 [Rhizophagus irregularis DAOM 181602=DAOM 197198]|eukprot:XP_025189673.1 hypothetical protein GLOIN_2v1493923 [Rhizophagus irregularis DAOM 181602=DAOM 197198]